MLVLGIESSAHTFGVGIVKDGKVIANVKSMYDVGTTGMIPNKVAEFHAQNFSDVIKKALEAANVSVGQLEGIGYTRGPGLAPCLQVGQLAAKTMANKLKIPIAPVNHGIGHIEIARDAAKMKEPIVLYVSGGNSQILKLTNKPFRHYQVLGETFDIGIGNMFDSFARALKLKPSWGSTVEKVAEGGKYIDMPFTVKGMDFSFTGLQTHATKLIGKVSDKDLCFSLREVSFSIVCEATERALLLTNSKEIIVCGGVAQSQRLRQMLNDIAKEQGVKFGAAANEFNADNGAMIAFVAERMLKSGFKIDMKDCDIEQRYRVESATVY